MLVAAGGRELRSSSSLHAAIEEAGDELAIDLLRGTEAVATRLRLAGAAIAGRAAAAPTRRGEHCV